MKKRFTNARACLSIVDSDQPGHPGSHQSALRHQLSVPPVVIAKSLR